MPVISAAIVSKSGRILLARQFMDVSRIRIEGLLSAFPKLVGTSNRERQATYIDSGSVRYVYQHLEQLYLVLVTTKGGNILEDITTLRLISRVLPEYCPVMEEERVLSECFPIMFAMDEIVTNSGHREASTVDQVIAAIEMHSTEEEKWNELEAQKKKAAALAAKEAAKRLKAEKFGGPSHKDEDIDDMFGEPQQETKKQSATHGEVIQQSVIKTSRTTTGMQFGKKKKDGNTDKILNEVGDQAIGRTGKALQQPQQAAAASLQEQPVQLKIEEKINVNLSKEGSIQAVDVQGSLIVIVIDGAAANVRLHLGQQNSDFNFKPHPNINKDMYTSDSILSIKGGKTFPVNNPTPILRWRAGQLNQTKVPLHVNCWPSGNAATVEYELENTALTLTNVQIVLPLKGATPEVGDVSIGDTQFDADALYWTIPVIDASSSSGTLDIELNTELDEDSLSPISIGFACSHTLAGVHVTAVVHADTQQSVEHSTELSVVSGTYTIE